MDWLYKYHFITLLITPHYIKGGIIMFNSVSNQSVLQNEVVFFVNYKDSNLELFENSIIQNFFTISHHVQLICQYLSSKSIEHLRELDVAFRHFLFQIRFIKYMSSLIKYATIDFIRKSKKDEKLNILIFDKQIDEQGDICLGELLFNFTVRREKEIIVTDPYQFQESIEDDQLFAAFAILTKKQKVVVTLSYSACALDTEIASKLAVSQQAITKTRLSELNKMKKTISPKFLTD
jgi:hypothetical protein